MATFEAKSMRLEAAAGRLGEIAERVGEAGVPVRLKRGRRTVAVLVSSADAALAARERRAMAAETRAYDRAKAAFVRDGKRTVGWEAAKQEIVKAAKR